MKCRFCNTELKYEFIDLLNSPPSNSYLTTEQLNEPEVYYPLKIFVCDTCFLVQVDEYKKSDEIFNSEYAYFSSVSTSWLKHSREYVDMITERLNLTEKSHVVEIASNDGYLLQYFVEKRIPCLGIEPAASTAKIAKERGVDVKEDFFGVKLAETLNKADLILGNNVLAHVPDINDFVRGLKIVLKPDGTITMEFPHLLNLIKFNQFDTIYHEHFSYLSLFTVKKIFSENGLKIYDVEELVTHGGSLRIYACHADRNFSVRKNVENILVKEKTENIDNINGYRGIQKNAEQIKLNFLRFLINAKNEGKKVVAYGAAAKGNTLLNFCGIKNDLIQFVVDAAPSKQNKFLPGSHVPIVKEDELKKNKPDYIIIFPWNIRNEIINQLEYVKEWNCKFVLTIPALEIIG